MPHYIYSKRKLGRRTFIFISAMAGAAAVSGTAYARPKLRRKSPNEKLNLAIIGAGGRGAANTKEVSSENIVALCDVDQNALDAAADKVTGART